MRSRKMVLAGTALGMGLGGLAAAGMPAAWADEHAEHSAHSHGATSGSKTGSPATPEGRTASGKWATDETLRKGMSALREIANSPQPDPARIDAELGNIFRNCKLPATADHALHPILEKIIAAKQTLAAKPDGPKRRAAAARIEAALREYGQHFDHPGWADQTGR